MRLAKSILQAILELSRDRGILSECYTLDVLKREMTIDDALYEEETYNLKNYNNAETLV